MCQIDWSAIAIVFATLGGPVLAVWASDIRAERKRIRDRKEQVFHTLMATRGARMQTEHVSALNRIELAFPQSSHPKIVDAWGQYLRQLETDQGKTDDSLNRWSATADNLFQELMQTMANDLKIPFSKTSIKHNAYYPKGYVFTESQQNELRSLLLEVLRNERSINMNATVYTPSLPSENKDKGEV